MVPPEATHIHDSSGTPQNDDDIASLLSRLEADGDPAEAQQYSYFERAEWICRSVSAGMLNAAAKLAGKSDAALHCAFIHSLYCEGYVALAEQNLSEIPPALLRKPKPPYQEISRIYGEILYDQARYEEAGSLFIALAEICPTMPTVRYAATACHLQEKIQRLRRRMELYHPDQEEVRKIEKYIHGFMSMIEIIAMTQWHTSWNEAQSRNLPEYLKTDPRTIKPLVSP
ncbi:tetratricopeptide repeat protein [Paenibacillus aceti]|uniref:Tetratricopeptide repeat protein n=1 Tax=Paenibacillus aceti TaxID=1820010 RepID=A0ABQ1W8F6_9BACL|nr:tetratricopeptide repeat protein [Paenibacillus aceti]GGG19150.1 hypothetical protein GCM10010913_46570 [Paenibacillus aceti]